MDAAVPTDTAMNPKRLARVTDACGECENDGRCAVHTAKEYEYGCNTNGGEQMDGFGWDGGAKRSLQA